MEVRRQKGNNTLEDSKGQQPAEQVLDGPAVIKPKDKGWFPPP